MSALNDFLQRFDGRARLGLIAGALVIAGATVALGAWTLRTDYQVLFADLAPQDAATMAAELDKMKTPFRLSGEGNTILVPAELVYKTRLKLVGKELPLRGAVGLELFNASEVGMTEFTQKVNYQRALQGEITRTILSLDEVQSVRVHLVLPEQGLFKKSAKQAKASITLAVKAGRTLEPSQVQGIQRLVGAAVPDIRADDVTIVDQHGVALTRRSAADGAEAAAPTDGLDDKRALESYLNKKVIDVLDRTFGVGQGIASVDVTLNRDQSKVTTENVLGGPGQQANGVLVRERRTTRENEADAAPAADGQAAAPGATLSHEADYQVGRRVEQVVSAPGAISRVAVAVVVKGVLDQTQLDRLKDVVALAAGINKARGDAVSVYSVDQIANPAGAAPTVSPAAPDTAAADTVAADKIEQRPVPATGSVIGVLFFLLGIAVLLALLVWRLTQRKLPPPLSLEQRAEMLDKVNGWLAAPDASAKEPG